MKAIHFLNIFIIVFILIPLYPLQSQETTEQEERKVYFFTALGENLFINTALYLSCRYIGQEPWAQISFDSIERNFTSEWEWDRDEFFTNQFFHPYMGAVYHTAARANGFTFYESLFFDAFGSATYELLLETNLPSINDLINTTIGGASLGEMFHRLYLEIPSPLALLVSPTDMVNDLITGRKSPRITKNIYALDVALGIGYTSSRQSREQNKGALQTTHSASTDVSAEVVYGDPFTQQSHIPYNHFEFSVYGNIASPFWYNLNIRSDGYLFSLNVIDDANSMASTGLSLHYDFFTDRHINFFGQSVDWTFKYKHTFNDSQNIEFKGHLGAVVFSADSFHLSYEYTNFRQTLNDYGAGVNMKLAVSTTHKKWGKFALDALAYEVFSVYKNANNDGASTLFLNMNSSYSYPLREHLAIGVGSSFWGNTPFYQLHENTARWTNVTKFFTRWSY